MEQKVNDFIATSCGIFFATDYIEKIDLDGNNRMKISKKGDYNFLDIFGGFIFYSDGHNYYAISIDGKENYIVKKNITGALITDNKFFYIDSDKNLVYFDIDTKETSIIDKGRNVIVYNDDIFYIKGNCIRKYSNKDCIFPEDKEDINIKFYYNIGNMLYILYEDELNHSFSFISLDIKTGEINTV